MNIELQILHPEAVIPEYKTGGAAAVDLHVCRAYDIPPGETCMCSTGIAIHIADSNVVGMIFPRSGLGISGLILANTAGVIDSDYQGELKVALWNRSAKLFRIEPGDRIAQLLFLSTKRAEFRLVQSFSNPTTRGAGGFGSTGR